MARTPVGQVASATLVGSVSQGHSSAATTTVSHTVPAGSNLMLIVTVSTQDSNDANLPVTGVTFGGVALTKAKETAGNPNDTCAGIWYLINPTPSTANVVVTPTGAVFTGVICSTWSNILQGAPEVTGGTFGTAATVSLAITTLTKYALVIDCASHKGSFTSVGANQTRIATETGQSFEHNTSSYGMPPAAGSFTTSQVWGSSNSYSYSQASFPVVIVLANRSTAGTRTTAGTRLVATP